VFVVVATHPVSSEWEQREASLYHIAGRRWDHGERDERISELRWFCRSLSEAVLLRQALSHVGGVNVISRDPVDGR
jgi:hypothetical protein